jgi:cobalt-zinc-cadmium efflux system membrane fusion protein
MSYGLLAITTVFLSLLLITGCGKAKHPEHSDHKDYSEASRTGHAEENGKSHESHAGEAPDAHAGEAAGAHEGEGEIEISSEGITMAGITLAKVTIGKIKSSIDLSGEVGFNEDRLVHITPRYPGIVKEANFKIGEFVSSGSTVAIIESNESMTPYVLKATISGRIIEKHAAPGEHVSGEESIYLLADLSSVWVNLAVYPKDASKIKLGQKTTITAIGTESGTVGSIDYITPVMDPQTRRITARAILLNNNNIWRPGTFVTAHIEVAEGEEGLVVEKDAVQIVNNETVVFVQHEPNTFRPVDVTTGESDSRYIRILNGLTSGIEYVNNGAFELKAKMVTTSLGGHAGHGH